MNDLSIRFEECARRILQRELGTPVILNDDGREAGLYDLRIGSVEAPAVAIECTAAIDPIRTETWNIGPARGPLLLNLNRDWYVVLRPNARIRALRREIERVLRECELAEIEGYTPVAFHLKRQHPSIFDGLHSLGVDSIHPSGEQGAGVVHLGMTGVGGAVDPTGSAVPGWIGEFLRDPTRSDVILKLQRSRAVECHVFIGVSFCGVPWEVESYLGTRTDLLPGTAPDLPAPICAAWIMYGSRGVRWDGTSWQFFNAQVPALLQ